MYSTQCTVQAPYHRGDERLKSLRHADPYGLIAGRAGTAAATGQYDEPVRFDETEGEGAAVDRGAPAGAGAAMGTGPPPEGGT